MLVVKCETLDSYDQPVSKNVIVAESVAKAIESIILNPAEGAVFRITVLNTDVQHVNGSYYGPG